MSFLKYLAKRLGTILFSVVVIIVLTYVLMWAAPGNFFDLQRFQTGSAASSNLTQAELEVLKKGFEEKYSLNKPLYEQIFNYLVSAAQFKFGPSFNYPNRTIEDMILTQLPVTLLLGVMAIAFAILIGIPLGVLAALKRNSWLDYLANFVAMAGQVIPGYVLALLLVLLFSVGLQWLPTSGWGGPETWVMPVFALSLGPLATIARFTRVSLLDTLGQDYIRTAYAKGGSRSTVILQHGLRNSLIPITSILGPSLAGIIGGSAVFIESYFRIPGIGYLFANAAQQRDYPLLVTATFVLALATMLLNMLVDIVYALLDPRIKLE